MREMCNSVEPHDIAKRFKLSLLTVKNKEYFQNGYHQLYLDKLRNNETSYEFYPTLAQINRTREYLLDRENIPDIYYPVL